MLMSRTQQRNRPIQLFLGKTHGAIGFVEMSKVMSDSWKHADASTKIIFHDLYKEGREKYMERVAKHYAKSHKAHTTERNPSPTTSACNIRSNVEMVVSTNPIQKGSQCRSRVDNISASDTSTGSQLQSQEETSVDMESYPRSMIESSSIIRSIPTPELIAEENVFEVGSLMQDDSSSADTNHLDETNHDVSPGDYIALIRSLIE